MSPQPRPGPQSPSPPQPHATAPRELTSPAVETDVAELAAHFAEKGGAGITAEMSSELALDVVLNEIVEQACQATNATGAAIALVRAGEMVCRASSGATAPDLGARLDTSSGLTGECCATRQTQHCDDALVDERVDIEASARLGVRSVIVMPLVRGPQLVGVFELLSCWPSAFSQREGLILEELASRVIRSLERAEQAAKPRVEVKRVEVRPVEVKPVEEKPVEEKRVREEVQEKKKERVEKPDAFPAPDLALARKISESQHAEIAPVPVRHVEPVVVVESGGFDFLSFSLGAAVLACMALLGVALGRRFEERRVANSHHAAVRTAQAAAPAPVADPAAQTAASSTDGTAAQTQTAAPNPNPAVPPGGLVIYEGGREVFRSVPSNTPGSAAAGAKRAAAGVPVLKMPAAQAENILTSRVEPEYPDEALRLKIQGAVVLSIRIGTDGSVEDIQFGSGPAHLAEAAVNAVKQWKFKPQVVNGHPAEVETSVTLNFRLPG